MPFVSGGLEQAIGVAGHPPGAARRRIARCAGALRGAGGQGRSWRDGVGPGVLRGSGASCRGGCGGGSVVGLCGVERACGSWLRGGRHRRRDRAGTRGPRGSGSSAPTRWSAACRRCWKWWRSACAAGFRSIAACSCTQGISMMGWRASALRRKVGKRACDPSRCFARFGARVRQPAVLAHGVGDHPLAAVRHLTWRGSGAVGGAGACGAKGAGGGAGCQGACEDDDPHGDADPSRHAALGARARVVGAYGRDVGMIRAVMDAYRRALAKAACKVARLDTARTGRERPNTRSWSACWW